MSSKNAVDGYGTIVGVLLIIIPMILVYYLESKDILIDSIGYSAFCVMVFGIAVTITQSIRLWKKSIIYKIVFLLTALFSAFLIYTLLCFYYFCPE